MCFVCGRADRRLQYRQAGSGRYWTRLGWISIRRTLVSAECNPLSAVQANEMHAWNGAADVGTDLQHEATTDALNEGLCPS